MINQLIFLILGLIGLWFGSDFLIKGGKNLAENFGISPFFIGIAFISIGTSIPEIAVSVTGGLQRLAGLETSGLVVGNIIGSAINQIGLFFGVLAFFIAIRSTKKEAIKQGSFLIAAVLLLFLLSYDGNFSRTDGIIAIAAYILYQVVLWRSLKSYKSEKKVTVHPVKDLTYMILGLILILYASEIVVKNGVNLADSLGVSQVLIGIFLIGIGTGLPELSVAIASARKGILGFSTGTLVGSNICDLLLGLGSGTAISGFLVEKRLINFDIPILLLLSFLVIGMLYSEREISKKEGALLISVYLIYALARIFVF